MGGFCGATDDLIIGLRWLWNPSAEDPVCGKIEAGQCTDWLASSLFEGGIVYS
jgi:hypothetical protein